MRSTVRLAVVLAIAPTAPAAGQPGPTLVSVESRVDAAHNGFAIITNLARVPLTAYLLDVIIEPCAPMQPRSILRAVDSAVSPDGHSIRPSESRTEQLGTSPCNKIGVSTPARAELHAAIFEDGSTSGSQDALTMLMEDRRQVLEQCEAILDQLRAAATAGTSPEALNSDVRARAESTRRARTLPFPPPVDLAALISAHLTARPSAPRGQIERAVEELERLRQQLLASRPSLR